MKKSSSISPIEIDEDSVSKKIAQISSIKIAANA